jgi:hypothetical protein
MSAKRQIGSLLVILGMAAAAPALAFAPGGGKGGGGSMGSVGGGGSGGGGRSSAGSHVGGWSGGGPGNWSGRSFGGPSTPTSRSFGGSGASPTSRSFGGSGPSPTIRSFGGSGPSPAIRSFGGSGPGPHGSPSPSGYSPRVWGGGVPRVAPGLNHPVNPQQWRHDGKWSGTNPDWDRGHGHHDEHGKHDFHHRHYFPYVVTPLWWNYYRPYYAWYRYPYYGDDYGLYDYGSYDYGPATYSAELPTISEEPAAPDEDWGGQYLASAREAFRQGSYADALRLAGHAAVELPRSPKPHELMSLALFALKDYRGANLEAHAALSLGPAADWPTLHGYYGNVPAYSKQLDALVEYLRAHQDAADARFVLAYHDLMMGHREAAKLELEKVLAKVPQDKVAADLLKTLGGTPSAAPPQPPAPPAKSPAG